MRARLAVASVVVPFLIVGTASAQSSDSSAAQVPLHSVERADSARRDWLVAFSVGLPGYGSETAGLALTTVGMQWTQARLNRPAADGAFGILPIGFAAGAAVFGMRGGLAFPVQAAPGVILLPSGGVSAVAGLGMGGADGIVGYNAGLAAVVLARSGVGLRVGTTFHRFEEVDGAIWLLELGIVRGPRQ